MTLKQYTRYQIDFKSKWTSVCGVLMGLSFFLRLIYYFGLTNIYDLAVVEILSTMIPGAVLCLAYLFTLSVMRLNAPGVYGILGAVHCFLLMFGTFSSGDGVRIALAVIWYVLAAGVLLLTVGGYLPGRLLASLVFFVPAVVRLFVYDLNHVTLLQWVREFGVLFALVGLACLPMGLKFGTQKSK
ncbi:MAG: hypothetical protein E7462_06505 [Ruminococcaceae bacterium]|nr:hypothetical protein [Oscillospiraceae bacterium]